MNGDSIPDLLISAPGGSSTKGNIFVMYGAKTGLANIDVSSVTSSQAMTIEGAYSSALAGEKLDSNGDYNNDGIADMLIGCPQETGGSTTFGRVYVVYGTCTAPGFFLSGNKCAMCQSGCKVCANANTCQTCIIY